jgi:hypothetical protein
VILSLALGGARARVVEGGLMTDETALHRIEVGGSPIAQSLIRARVGGRVALEMEAAGGLIALARRGTEHESILSEFAVEHAHIEPQGLAAGFGPLVGGRRASEKGEGSGQESGEGAEAGHWALRPAARACHVS